jgi:transcription initiation factor IIE alpha subunit
MKTILKCQKCGQRLQTPDLQLDVKQLFEECKALRDKLTKAEEEVNMLRTLLAATKQEQD